MDKITADAVLQAAAALFNSFTFERLLPSVMLVLLLIGFAVIFQRLQRRTDFDLADMFRDATGKTDPWRLFAFGCFIFTTWTLQVLVLSGHLQEWAFWIYCITWAGSPAALVLANKWNGALPFTKPKE